MPPQTYKLSLSLRTNIKAFHLIFTLAGVTVGEDPHFSIVLPSKKLLCFSVQGSHGYNYNLISNKHLVMNAKFIPDSHRNEVTWIGSLGFTIHGANYGGHNTTAIRFESTPPSISINSKVWLDPHDIKHIAVINGKLRIAEDEISTGFKYPSVKFNVAGISFSTFFKREHLDLFWHSTQQQTENSHGLIGMLSNVQQKAMILLVQEG